MWLKLSVILLFGLSSAQDPFGNNFGNTFGQQWSPANTQTQVNQGNWETNVILNEASFFIVAGRMVRPGQVYRVAATVYSMRHPLTIVFFCFLFYLFSHVGIRFLLPQQV